MKQMLGLIEIRLAAMTRLCRAVPLLWGVAASLVSGGACAAGKLLPEEWAAFDAYVMQFRHVCRDAKALAYLQKTEFSDYYAHELTSCNIVRVQRARRQLADMGAAYQRCLNRSGRESCNAFFAGQIQDLQKTVDRYTDKP